MTKRLNKRFDKLSEAVNQLQFAHGHLAREIAGFIEDFNNLRDGRVKFNKCIDWLNGKLIDGIVYSESGVFVSIKNECELISIESIERLPSEILMRAVTEMRNLITFGRLGNKYKIYGYDHEDFILYKFCITCVEEGDKKQFYITSKSESKPFPLLAEDFDKTFIRLPLFKAMDKVGWTFCTTALEAQEKRQADYHSLRNL
jgi:hypothetical protein